MAYGQARGRRPAEYASKSVHSQVINNPEVQACIEGCVLPAQQPEANLKSRLREVPAESGRIKAVIAIDGGYAEAAVRDRHPSATIAFLTFGPLYFKLSDLQHLDTLPFLGPDDMARLKNLQRYSLAIPTRGVLTKGCSSFRMGVRKRLHDWLTADANRHLLEALQWLIFRGWRDEADRQSWEVPRCPNDDCNGGAIAFSSGDPQQKPCSSCGSPVFVSDALRLYERIDEELGAGGILGYLLTSLEQLVLVHLVKMVVEMKPAFLREILFVKDGPLAFFGVTAPLYRPMRDLMTYLNEQGGTDGPLINLAGVEKSGAFAEHAMVIEERMSPGHALVLDNDYIYRNVIPGDPKTQSYGKNSYYGGKVIFKALGGEVYVVTIPTGEYVDSQNLSTLFNAADVLQCTGKLRCSMYDNALLPVALANRLVSLAHVPSTAILEKFVRDRVRP